MKTLFVVFRKSKLADTLCANGVPVIDEVTSVEEEREEEWGEEEEEEGGEEEEEEKMELDKAKGEREKEEEEKRMNFLPFLLKSGRDCERLPLASHLLAPTD